MAEKKRKRDSDVDPTSTPGVDQASAALPAPAAAADGGQSFYVLPPPTGRPVRIYADGIFDMFHYGHARLLEQCKTKLLPGHEVVLIVGINSDAVTHKLKGQTVMTEYERYESVRHCRWVDEVVEDAPWVVTQEFLDKHNIDYIAHDAAPYPSTDGSGDVYGFAKRSGRFLATQRTDGISTSDLIFRIVKNYDEYVKRNIARGYSFDDMNVGFLKRRQITLETAVKQTIEKSKELIDEVTHLPLMRGFLSRFGHRGDGGTPRLHPASLGNATPPPFDGAGTDTDSAGEGEESRPRKRAKSSGLVSPFTFSRLFTNERENTKDSGAQQ
eukprot:TRINITY_DN17690_c0_g1_i1.p1 TRINITY_DN17690_c0_g1~~TRINITY_DN17690_c0_g1_i1.p1  ORF type:complete len:327 (-),score=57.81 TRINITY_DN17690_c0_g1_i1:15-995(-)